MYHRMPVKRFPAFDTQGKDENLTYVCLCVCVFVIFIVRLFALQWFEINPVQQFNRNIVRIYRIYNRTGTIIQFDVFNCAPNVLLMARGTHEATHTHTHIYAYKYLLVSQTNFLMAN